jgi:transcriptional regulator with XRE-family HTH domain
MTPETSPLALLRERKALSLGVVAERMGTRKPNVSQFENGILDVAEPFIVRYAKSLGVAPRTVRKGYWQAVYWRCQARMKRAIGFGAERRRPRPSKRA